MTDKIWDDVCREAETLANPVYTAGDIAALIEMHLDVYPGPVSIDRARIAAWAKSLRKAQEHETNYRTTLLWLREYECSSGNVHETEAELREYATRWLRKSFPEDASLKKECSDCPPADYPTDATRCASCPYRGAQ